MECTIYCDEAGTHGCRYFLIGGLWMPRHDEIALRQQLSEVRQDYGLRAEMHWKKVSDLMLPAYKAFVDVVLLWPAVSFKCIVVEKSRVDYNTYHDGDKDLAFYKFYYYVISHNLESHNLYWLYTDERSSRDAASLSKLRLHVNERCNANGADNILRAIEPRKSHSDDLIQCADVILGSISAAWQAEVTKQAKHDLIGHIANRFGLECLATPTPRTNKKINIWQWQPHVPKVMGSKKRPIP
ncbi:MAG: DUF3800 domain-containing protein [Chloroflexota bacterium]|nr:DUF3800 domain-containing protein [Chloroflexota bacterium]